MYHIESEIDKDYAGELSYHNLFAYACQLTNRLSHCHVLFKNLYTSIMAPLTRRNFSVGNFK